MLDQPSQQATLQHQHHYSTSTTTAKLRHQHPDRAWGHLSSLTRGPQAPNTTIPDYTWRYCPTIPQYKGSPSSQHHSTRWYLTILFHNTRWYKMILSHNTRWYSTILSHNTRSYLTILSHNTIIPDTLTRGPNQHGNTRWHLLILTRGVLSKVN